MFASIAVMMLILMRMVMTPVSSCLLLPVFLPRQILFPINVNVYLRGRNPTAHHP